MKKINEKKLNAYFRSGNNASQMKDFVTYAVTRFLDKEATEVQIQLLIDLNLITE